MEDHHATIRRMRFETEQRFELFEKKIVAELARFREYHVRLDAIRDMDRLEWTKAPTVAPAAEAEDAPKRTESFDPFHSLSSFQAYTTKKRLERQIQNDMRRSRQIKALREQSTRFLVQQHDFLYAQRQKTQKRDYSVSPKRSNAPWSASKETNAEMPSKHISV